MDEHPSIVYGIGAVEGLCDEIIELGALHPSAHGGLRIRIEARDGVVTAADPMPGLLHRGAEKLMEARDYRQVLMLASRHDWLAGFSSEVGAALAVEDLLGIEVPGRATWIRMLLAELTRITAGAMFLGASVPLDAGRPLHMLRDRILDHVEDYTGGRVHPMITRIGGLAAAPDPGWFDDVSTACDEARTVVMQWTADVLPQLTDPGRGIAVLDREAAIDYAASGPVGRASGIDFDLRRDDPYLGYADLQVPVHVHADGDAAARFTAFADDVRSAIDLAAECARIAASMNGPVDVRLPKVVRAPEGRTYMWTENPSGINGYLLVSTGGPAPWRMKIRTASFAHVQSLAAALPGTPVEQLPLALASFFFVVGDIDR